MSEREKTSGEPRLAHEDHEAAELVARFQAGERDAFTDLYRRYFDDVYAYMRLLLKHRHEAEDATQQAFLQAFQGLATYERRPGQPFRGWLFVVARNCALRQLERSGKVDVSDPAEFNRRRDRAGGESNGLHALDWITDSDLMVLIDRLPITQRQVIGLRFLLGLTAREAATVLDRTPEAVGMLQHRALTFLRRRLIALGRDPRHFTRETARTYPRQARVVRLRRFSLVSNGPTG